MLYISQKDIEIIGESVLRDYNKRSISRNLFPFDIAAFAKEYLKLDIYHRRLSDSGKLMGLTTYRDILLELEFATGNVEIKVPEDTILVEEKLLSYENRRRERFTVAHECAHQVIARIEERQTGSSFRNKLESGRTYSCRELKTAEDWSEWQANSLGAVLLMPRFDVTAELNKGFAPFRPTLYGNRFNSHDYRRIKALADRYEVSFMAMVVRLRELGFIIYKSESEYRDPLVVEVG
jgi:hypothetical protein